MISNIIELGGKDQVSSETEVSIILVAKDGSIVDAFKYKNAPPLFHAPFQNGTYLGIGSAGCGDYLDDVINIRFVKYKSMGNMTFFYKEENDE